MYSFRIVIKGHETYTIVL